MATKNDDSKYRQILQNPALRNEGFRSLMKQYGQTLYWHIRRIVVGHDDAEDVLQETCIKILDNIDSFKGDGSLLTWLYRVATNEALQHLRRQTRLFQSIDSMGDALTSKLRAETMLDGHQLETVFQQALLTLPTQQRLAFNLRYYDELSYDDIAMVTGSIPANVKANYHNAKEKIVNYLKSND